MSGMIFVDFPLLTEKTLWNSLPDTVVKAESGTISREDWIDYGMIRKSNIVGKLTLKDL